MLLNLVWSGYCIVPKQVVSQTYNYSSLLYSFSFLVTNQHVSRCDI